MKYFRKKRLETALTVIFCIFIFIYGSKKLEVSWIEVFKRFANAADRFIIDYLPVDFSEFSRQSEQLINTVFLSIAGSATGVILGLLSALMISVKTSPNTFVKTVIRTIASICRNIPEGIWAIILLLCFWFGNFLAYLVMSIISYGFLTRVFADTIDETNSDAIEALEATGAGYWQIIIHGVLPETMPALISWSLYSIENNIRSATIVGMLAGGGIGYLMNIYKGFAQFPLMMSAILMVTILIIITDRVSTVIRRRIMS